MTGEIKHRADRRDPAVREYRRAYNREYMRRLRSDRRRVEQEKLREKMRLRPSRTNPNPCRWCERPAQGTVPRMGILPTGEFVEILVPYCGQC